MEAHGNRRNVGLSVALVPAIGIYDDQSAVLDESAKKRRKKVVPHDLAASATYTFGPIYDSHVNGLVVRRWPLGRAFRPETASALNIKTTGGR
jgi:hypothetical protein